MCMQEDFIVALRSFFKVEEIGGKSLRNFDEILQALEKEHSGPEVEWKKLFEEDREFNQGEFAECIRDQFLKERIEFIDELGVALYEEINNQDTCTEGDIVRAILLVDPEISEKEAEAAVSRIFPTGVDSLKVQHVMKSLSGGMLKGSSEIIEVKNLNTKQPQQKLTKSTSASGKFFDLLMSLLLPYKSWNKCILCRKYSCKEAKPYDFQGSRGC